MKIELKNKVAIITGASSGIGRATAEAFSEAGGRLVLTGRNLQKLEETKSMLNGQCMAIPGDICNAAFRRQLVDLTITEFGKIDALVNAAGIIGSGSVENTSLKDFDAMMDINVRSVFQLIQLALPSLIQTKGNIVNVSSVTGTRAFPGIFSYCVSKAAVDQLTRAAALDLAPKGVRVNAVNPGVVVTNLHKNGGMDSENYQKFLEHSKTTHPLGRVGQAREIADLILFLASDHAGWITGGIYNIDGGRHQTCAR